MVNALFDKGREAFLTANCSWIGDPIKAVLVDTGTYTPDLGIHQFLSDIPAPSRVSISTDLTTKTATAGIADADDVVFIEVTGPESEALVLYRDTGTETTSNLIAYIDTATGLPVQPNGGDVAVGWSNGPEKIFKL
jgi:hypothetical protein